MQVILQLFFRLLGEAIVPLAFKALRGIGFVAVTYTGVKLFMDQAKEYVFAQLLSVPAEWLQIIGLLKLDVCINILFSAYLIRAALWGMKQDGSKRDIKLG